MRKPELTHVAGTFLIQADGSFLNGAGLGEGDDRNTTIPKTFRDGRDRVPYVSAQAWKRWLRNTLIEETGWPASELRAIATNQKGASSKIAGELDPVHYPEDDIFGYMRAEKGPSRKKGGDEDNEGEDEEKTAGGKVKSVMRASPFAASLLVSLRHTGWQGRDEGFVHLKEGTPLPYTTEFYNTNLQAVFCLNYARLGVFANIGDRIELDESIAKSCLTEGSILDKGRTEGESKATGTIYVLKDAAVKRKERAIAIFNALSVLRGGAKQAAFGTDVAPKVLVIAGLTCGNPIFNHLFRDMSGKVSMDVVAFREIIKDYADRIVTPVLIGMRAGYLENEQEVAALAHEEFPNVVKVEVMTPIDAGRRIGAELP